MNHPTRTGPRLLSALLLLVPIATTAADDASGPVPRYRLKPGQELSYRGTSDFKYENGSLGTESDWRAWVLRANADGSWRLLLRVTSKMTQTYNGSKQGNGPADVSMAYCDLFPDGRIVANDSFGYRVEPSSIFPRLPADADQAKRGWDESNPRQGTRTEFKPSGQAKGAEWTFEGVPHSPTDKIYLSSSLARYTFDAGRGLVGRIETENAQGYGFNGKGTGTEELTSVEQMAPDRLAALARESDRYFEASRAYQALATEAGKAVEGAEAILARGEATLKAAREAIATPILRDQLDTLLKNHAQMGPYYAEQAKNRAEVVGRDAAAWDTKDLEGRPHSLAAYRGKVVVLDFWYRGCGWCIRAMPQMKQLADDFAGQPVAILGMNTDRVEGDARLVVDEMKLNYPTLKAEGLPEKYKVQGFPTLIIIDQTGKVADVHVGYSPTLREEVGKAIKDLLARK